MPEYLSSEDLSVVGEKTKHAFRNKYFLFHNTLHCFYYENCLASFRKTINIHKSIKKKIKALCNLSPFLLFSEALAGLYMSDSPGC